MSNWPEDEFQRVAKSTKLSQKTRQACRDVLVGGYSGVDVAVAHSVFPSAISRGLGILRERRDEMTKVANSYKDDERMHRFAVGEVARHVAGDQLEIVDPRPGQLYEGKIIAKAQGFLVQQLGRIGIIHDVRNLEILPAMNAVLTIDYPKGGGKALVRESWRRAR